MNTGITTGTCNVYTLQYVQYISKTPKTAAMTMRDALLQFTIQAHFDCCIYYLDTNCIPIIFIVHIHCPHLESGSNLVSESEQHESHKAQQVEEP